MKNRIIAAILCLCALLLCSCASQTANSGPALQDQGIETTSDDLPAVNEETSEEHDQAADELIREAQEVRPEWYDVYLKVISQAEADAQSDPAYAYHISYALYDMDRDDVPELVIRTGDCEAAYEGWIYRYDNGESRLLGTIGLGHSSLWTDPESDGVIQYWGHMGYCSAERIWFDSEGMKTERLFEADLNQNPELVEYPSPADYVPGSVGIPEMNGYLDLPLRRYKTIMTWLDGRYESNTDEVKSPEDNPSFYEDWMGQNGIVFAVSGDGFANSPGQIPFAELLKEDVLYQYMSSDVQPGEKRIGDLNGDGVSDCLVLLNGESSDAMTILSWQNGIVYAYLFFYPPSFDAVDNNGTFLSTEYGRYAFRYLFEGEQCQRIEVPESLFVES